MFLQFLKNRTRMLKSQSILEKMHPEDANVFASNTIDKYENRPDDLHSWCLVDFASNYVSKKSCDEPVESDDIKSYTIPVPNINDIEPNPNIIALKNKHGERRKRNIPSIIRFYKLKKSKTKTNF